MFLVEENTMKKAVAVLAGAAVLMSMALTACGGSKNMIYAVEAGSAGVPRRRPLVTNGDCGSFGIVFLLHVI